MGVNPLEALETPNRLVYTPFAMGHKVTVYLRDSQHLGRNEILKVREDGAQGLKDDVPTAMVRGLSEHWAQMGWSVIDERGSAAALDG